MPSGLWPAQTPLFVTRSKSKTKSLHFWVYNLHDLVLSYCVVAILLLSPCKLFHYNGCIHKVRYEAQFVSRLLHKCWEWYCALHVPQQKDHTVYNGAMSVGSFCRAWAVLPTTFMTSNKWFIPDHVNAPIMPKRTTFRLCHKQWGLCWLLISWPWHYEGYQNKAKEIS